jgi:hypothetical protein
VCNFLLEAERPIIERLCCIGLLPGRNPHPQEFGKSARFYQGNSFLLYDMKHTITLTGAVTELTLANPFFDSFRRERRPG